jgi:phage terminase large subunit GpA-like protein
MSKISWEELKKKVKKEELIYNFIDKLRPKDDLSIDTWADKYRYLSKEASHEAGQWRTSRFPFLKRIMEVLSPQHPATKIVFAKSAQIGATEIALNLIFYTIDYNPSSILYVQNTLENISIFIEQRFSPAVEGMPNIKAKLDSIATNTALNKSKIKRFPNGIIKFGGANSASSLRSMPIKILILDEEDSYPSDVGGEGSPSSLAEARTMNFPDKKIYHCSTPVLEELSVIEPLFKSGTRERYHVPCPHCNHFQVLRWENIKWEKNPDKTPNLETVRYCCEHCGVLIEEFHKTYMLENGKWIAENTLAEYPSFHINALYSPYGFYSWKNAVSAFALAIKDNDELKLKAFVNLILGESYSKSGKIVKATFLEAHKLNYKAEVPKEVVVLTAGADVQSNRVEIEIVGWSRNAQMYSIDYQVFLGDTTKPQVWGHVSQFLQKWRVYELGGFIPVSISMIDCGYITTTVYDFCRLNEHRNFFPIKGSDGWGKGYIKLATKRNQYGVFMITAYVDEIKNTLYSDFMIEDTQAPSYCYFPNTPIYNREYFDMLCSEKLEVHKGVLRWVRLQGKRNEALDCRAYSFAGLRLLNVDLASIPEGKIYIPSYGKMHNNLLEGHRERSPDKGLV